ncbi:DUF3806 domain-containing protein [Microvirga guangxiensis]|uniref:DUF3806 domain-containing protein n=1 Tax=Microvirga guangxiensis TaxID=549386 RepID=A0A1G5KU71_9HYPH|nr:DUF3806 domain-containing protein [Microvirga guangxiensis]SCZ04213.1 protein of unknown function [Microvirga guangxiensis]
MNSQPLYQSLWADHKTLLTERRVLLAGLLAHVSIESAQRFLDLRAIADHAVEEQEAIGVLIGDELVRVAGFKWVTMDDDYGSEPVVAHPHKMAVIAPLSALTNRFEDGDTPFDIRDLIENARAIVEEVDAKSRDFEE